MKNIFIQKDGSAEALSSLLKINEETLSLKILNFLWIQDIINDEFESIGKTLEQIIFDAKTSISGVCLLALGVRSQEVNRLFERLVLKWHLDDCDMCGFETETIEDGAFGKTWTEKRCTNINCGHTESNEFKQFAPFEND